MSRVDGFFVSAGLVLELRIWKLIVFTTDSFVKKTSPKPIDFSDTF